MTEEDGSKSGVAVDDWSAVPLFPLPGVVLFPRAVLPLHIFEHRYRLMTADALSGHQLVAMALLKPGWEREYDGRPPIAPVVCIGRILNSQRLPDSKYNLLLQGLARATVEHEWTDRPYRYARLKPVVESLTLEIDLSGDRDQLTALFSRRPLAHESMSGQFRELLAGPLPTSAIVDLVAFHFLDCSATKQRLLEETDVRRRVRATLHALERQVAPSSALPESVHESPN